MLTGSQSSEEISWSARMPGVEGRIGSSAVDASSGISDGSVGTASGTSTGSRSVTSATLSAGPAGVGSVVTDSTPDAAAASSQAGRTRSAEIGQRTLDRLALRDVSHSLSRPRRGRLRGDRLDTGRRGGLIPGGPHEVGRLGFGLRLAGRRARHRAAVRRARLGDTAPVPVRHLAHRGAATSVRAAALGTTALGTTALSTTALGTTALGPAPVSAAAAVT